MSIVLNPGSGGVTVDTEVIAGEHIQRVKIALGDINADDGDLSRTNALPVSIAVTALQNRSGTIALANTSQVFAATNLTRKGFWIKNNSTTHPLYINELGTAAADLNSLKIDPLALYESPLTGVSTGAIGILGPSTGQTFTAREW